MLSKEEAKVFSASPRTTTGGLSDTRALRIHDETGDGNSLPEKDDLTADVHQVEDHEDCGECWGECRF